jgi:hypothetical protein
MCEYCLLLCEFYNIFLGEKMVKIKVKSTASSWWAARNKILTEIKKVKPVKKNVKPKKVVAKKSPKAKKIKKANSEKKATKIKKTRK